MQVVVVCMSCVEQRSGIFQSVFVKKTRHNLHHGVGAISYNFRSPLFFRGTKDRNVVCSV